MNLNYALEVRQQARIVRLKAERVDHQVAARLKEVLYLQSREDPPAIVLDLSEVKEMDSSGLGALLFGKRQANARGGDLLLVGVAQAIGTMIQIAQLGHVFATFTSVDQALAFLDENKPNHSDG
ncbi:MAG: anti-sigma factor antagonist [Calditrichaeota bacterium]|nr:MAG: anti-sigma factor antagonist [Calditrichota bacterium]